MEITPIYAIVKFFAYSAWCYMGLRTVQPAAATIASSLRLGGVRWLIGLFFGAAVFVAVGSINASDAARTYFVVYTPVRLLEWGIMAWLVATGRRPQSSSSWTVRLPLWCAGGVLVSFVTDLLSPEGLQGRFCIGRCLC
jgi:hypothetical protein